MNASNAVIFEGATADAHETTLSTIDATGDRTINLPNVSGTLPVLAAASATAITSTPEELNILDGVTSTAAELNFNDGVTLGTAIASKVVTTDANIDITGGRNITISGELDAATGDFSGAVDVAGAFTSSAGAEITVADNSDNLTLISTDADGNAGPNLRMYRNSGSPADNDDMGRISFDGRNDNYARLCSR